MRGGGLVFRLYADIYRLDPTAIAAVDPDGAGPETAGYDEDFREPRIETPVGETAKPIRREMAAIRVPCQVEPDSFEALRMFEAGASPRSQVVLTMSFRDLRRLGLVDGATGEVLLRPSDRLGGIYERNGQLVQAVRDPPGLFVDQVLPESYGLSLRRPQRQIAIVTFRDHQQAAGRET